MNHKRLTAVGLVLMLAATECSTQNNVNVLSGTILAFSLTDQELIVAVDSRMHFGKPGVPATDSACKVIQLSEKAIFFYSGGAGEIRSMSTNELFFSANSLARDSYDLFREKPNQQRLREAAISWGQNMKSRLDRLLPTSPDARSSVGLVGLGGFGGLDTNGAPFLYLVNIGITVDQQGHAVSSSFVVTQADPNSPIPIGVGGTDSSAGVSEFLANKTVRAKTANREFEKNVRTRSKRNADAYRITAAVEAAVRWGKDDALVGGPVDAVVLERGKSIRWIQRKPQCRKQDCCSAARNESATAPTSKRSSTGPKKVK